MAKDTALAVKTSADVAIPDEFANDLVSDAGRGAEHVGREDLQVARLGIIQSLSPERNKQKSEYIPGIEEGCILNTVTQQWVPAETGVYVIPCSYQRRYTEWWPRDSKAGEGLVADHGMDATVLERIMDSEKGLTAQGTEIVTTGDFYVLQVDPETGVYSPVVISMGGTQLKKSRQWNTRMTTMRITVKGQLIQPPTFYMCWHLTTVPESNDKGSWYGWKLEPYKSVFELPGGATIYQDARLISKQVAEGTVKAAAAREGAPSRPAPAAAAPQAGADDDIPF